MPWAAVHTSSKLPIPSSEGPLLPLQIDAVRRRVSLDPRNSDFYNNPYPAYREIEFAAPVFFWEQYGYWCFCRHAAVSALLRDRRFGRQILHVASRESLGWPEPPEHLAPFNAIEQHSLLELEPPEHTRLRGLVNRAFVSRQVERLAPRIEALASELIDGFAVQGSTELISSYATPIPVAVIAELIGAPVETAPRLLDWSHRMVAMYQFGATRAIEEDAAGAARDISEFVRDIARRRRREPADDLISRLIEAEGQGARLTEDELVATCVLLLNAGHEATVQGIGNGVKALLENDAVHTVAGADPTENEAIADELLRFDSPLHLFTRYALQDVEIAGIKLRQGERIGLLLGAANRDRRAFAEPDRLDFKRATNPHLAFGAGIHFCVGAPLAKLEMRVALPVLLRRLPRLRLARPPHYRDAYHFHGLETLHVNW
jgi:cytochrome P450